jgi:hypothetical protein
VIQKFVKACSILLSCGVWLLLMAIFWIGFAPAFLYHCSDDALRLFPPFIHPEAIRPHAPVIDYYRADVFVVFACWGAWLIVTALGLWKIAALIARRKILLTSEGW